MRPHLARQTIVPASHITEGLRWRSLTRGVAIAAVLFVTASAARAQVPSPPPMPPQSQARVIVVGEGKVSVAPDYASIRGGVTTRAKTASEATDANSKAMTAVIAALIAAGIAEKDIQTERFSVQPVYAAPQPGAEQRLTGFSASNQVNVTVRDIKKVGDILDRLISSGATDIGSIEFLHSDTVKVLDQAREAAMADARRKAELYARAGGLTLGPIVWITEDSGYTPRMPMPMGARAASTPIMAGEDTLEVRVTVGFAIAQ